MEVEQLVLRGFFAVDSGAPDLAPKTAENFELVLPNTTISGDQYRGFVAKRATADYTTRHCVSNFRLVRGSDVAVTVAFIVTAHRLNAGAAAPIVNVADFVDEWTAVDGGWEHRSRDITPAFPVVS
jgi:hypothetical protein